MNERLVKLINVDNLKDKNILLVGVGGVGSFCFEVLIRSGIKNITIIDFDTYEESNINRQLNSSINTIGLYKVDVLAKHAKEIDPNINITISKDKLDSNSNLDYKKYDYIIDACDSVDAKINIITNAIKNNVKVISSMGIGNRVLPGHLRVIPFKKVNGDPLAKKLRIGLKNAKFEGNFMCVASDEVPIKSNPISSYIAVTSYAGILLADYVIKELTNE